MLSAPDPTLPPGEPPRPVCQRCGRSVDEGAIGTQVGLCHCMICEVYACRWCWADGDGTCPSCGVRYAPAALLAVAPADDPGVATAAVTGAVVAGAGGSSTPGRRPDIRAPLAIGTLVVALALLGLTFGGPLGSTAGSIEATPTPALGVVAGAASGGTPSRSAAPSGEAIASGTQTSVPTSTARLPVSTATTDGASPGPPAATPAATTAPTPRPTATPQRTPSPTPRPTPTPHPTPGCKPVPDLKGSRVAAARAAWTAAGFTGAFNDPKGPDTWYVQTQDPPNGACVATSTGMTVTSSKSP